LIIILVITLSLASLSLDFNTKEATTDKEY
jgi:hypothetical protein